jgi:preprotein translocase SecE subunit
VSSKRPSSSSGSSSEKKGGLAQKGKSNKEGSADTVTGDAVAVSGAGGYLSKSVAELKKVTFPSREETIKTSLWAVMFLVSFAIVLSLLDVFFRFLMMWLI